MSTEQRIDYLFSKYLKRELLDEEFHELLIWLHEVDEKDIAIFSASLKKLWQQARSGELPSSANQVDWERVFQRAIDNQNVYALPAQRSNRISWLRIAAAAALVMVLTGVIYWTMKKTPLSPQVAAIQRSSIRLPETVKPGNKTATLTLADGVEIVLNDAANGAIAQQGGSKVVKLDSGQIFYKAGNSGEVVFNVIATPRAAEYQVVLPDGTRVWLNASSSLRFPTAFVTNERRVELTGEGYFEVAKDPAKPFRVKVNRSAEAGGGVMEVEALGTHFNIMAYDNEDAIRTTLLEGVVKVSLGASAGILQPGKEAQLKKASPDIRVNPANVNIAVAWKNGYFYFEKADVKTILRQVSRWYDLDIVYAETPPDLIFSGKIERNLPLSGILRLLQHSKINFRIEGHTLIVLS